MSDSIRISALIFARNERFNIERLIPRIRPYVDEIIVVDGCSTDGTYEIATYYGAKVFRTKPWGFVEPCRMYGISKTTYNWILYIDADEYPSRALLKDLRKIVKYAEEKDFKAIRIRRQNFFISTKKPLIWLSLYDYQIRIFKKGYVIYKGIIHEQPQVLGKTLVLKDPKYYILHWSPGSYSLKNIRSKLLKYAYIVSLMRQDKRKSTLFTLLLPLILIIRIFKYIVVKKAFIDGYQGIESALAYITYLTAVDILKTFRSRRGDIISFYLNKYGTTFLCKEECI